jgi:Ion transport protein
MNMANRLTATATPTAPNAVPDPPGRHPHRRTLKDIATEAILDPTSDAYGITLKVVLVAILASIVVLALETIHPLVDDYADVFHAVDLSLLAIFTVEYLLHLWVAPDRRKYVLSLWGIVDLLAILPAYIELTLGGSQVWSSCASFASSGSSGCSSCSNWLPNKPRSRPPRRPRRRVAS